MAPHVLDTGSLLPLVTKTYTYYHAGPLFSLAELHTNSLLASSIHRISNGRYKPILPQDLEQRDTSPHAIRDADIRALLCCDLALFTYDGSELDSGTVVEYMLAKFADIPAVILRTDFRGAGDQGGKGDPWNLMSSFWPRTKGVVVDSMLRYKVGLADAGVGQNGEVVGSGGNAVDLEGGASRAALRSGELMLCHVAEEVVKAMDEVVSMPAKLPRELREPVYQWLALMPGFRDGSDKENVLAMRELLSNKEKHGLFPS